MSRNVQFLCLSSDAGCSGDGVRVRVCAVQNNRQMTALYEELRREREVFRKLESDIGWLILSVNIGELYQFQSVLAYMLSDTACMTTYFLTEYNAKRILG